MSGHYVPALIMTVKERLPMDEVTVPRCNTASGENLCRLFEDTQGKLFMTVNKLKIIPVIREECCSNPPRAEGNENIIEQSRYLGSPAAVFEVLHR